MSKTANFLGSKNIFFMLLKYSSSSYKLGKHFKHLFSLFAGSSRFYNNGIVPKSKAPQVQPDKLPDYSLETVSLNCLFRNFCRDHHSKATAFMLSLQKF